MLKTGTMRFSATMPATRQIDQHGGALPYL
jgi:hypothetical protein